MGIKAQIAHSGALYSAGSYVTIKQQGQVFPNTLYNYGSDYWITQQGSSYSTTLYYANGSTTERGSKYGGDLYMKSGSSYYKIGFSLYYSGETVYLRGNPKGGLYNKGTDVLVSSRGSAVSGLRYEGTDYTYLPLGNVVVSSGTAVYKAGSGGSGDMCQIETEEVKALVVGQ